MFAQMSEIEITREDDAALGSRDIEEVRIVLTLLTFADRKDVVAGLT